MNLEKEEEDARIEKVIEGRKMHELYFDEIKWMESCGPVAKVGYMTAEDEKEFRKRYGTYFNSFLIYRFECY